MSKLTPEQYQQLTQDADVLTEDFIGEKVLRLHDGKILKLFRVKRWWSSARLFNYAKRFFANAQQLQKKQIVTVTVNQYLEIPHIKRTAVIYEPLSGANIRDIATRHQHKLNLELIERLGRFIAQLHNQGIYFRSLHLGNIVLTADDQLGLIDIADMKIKDQSLPLNLRLRNFKHLARYQEDIDLLQCGQNGVFADAYVASANSELTAKEVEQLKLLLGM